MNREGKSEVKKVIVTGANGFIGKALLEVLSDAGMHVYALVREGCKDTAHLESMNGVQIIACDLEHVDRLPEMIKDTDIDTCIHLAWSGSFGDMRADYELQLTNVTYALKMIDVVAGMGVKRFVGAGTLAEKDVLNYHPADGAVPNPVSIYGIAKVAAHFMTKTECTKLGMEHVWCYLSNTYGVGNTTDNFINMACKKIINGERAAFTAGEQMYDFVYITDTVRAIFAAADKGKANCSYYLGSNAPRKLKEYIRTIRDTIDPSAELFLGEIPFRGKPLEEDAYETKKLIADTGYQPKVTFEDGIQRTVEWLRKEMHDTNI